MGTGSIAIPPAPIITYSNQSAARARKKPEKPMAKPATARRPASRTRRQLEEDLKGAGHQMDRIDGGGEGLQSKSTTSDDTGKQDSDFSEIGKEWPRDHTETEAMCDVDEDGTEHEPQGSHESTHGEADDGIQDKLGHDWPDEPKNSGGSMAEFGNHIKGAEMTGWKGPKGEGVPKTVDVDGGRKTEIGGKGKTEKIGDSDQDDDKLGEDWNPDHISGLMEDNVYGTEQLQRLFDLYARDNRQVTLEDFQELLDANGILNTVNESTFVNLLDNNQEYMFHVLQDNMGKYWLSEGIPAAFKKNQFKKGGKKGDSDKDDKPSFLKGKGKKDKESDDEDDEDDKPDFLKEGVPPEFKQHQFGKGGKKGSGKSTDKESTPKKKKSMKECSKTCKEWLDRARGIHEAMQDRQITPQVARRALQISLNMGLTRQDIRESAPQIRTMVAQAARSYRLSIDNRLQSLAEGFYDAQQPGGAPGGGAGGVGGPPDPFGQAPLGEVEPGMMDPNDPMAGQDLGAPEDIAGGMGGGMGDPAAPGIPGELPEDPAFMNLPPEGGMGGPGGMDNMGMGGPGGMDNMGGPGGMDDMGMGGPGGMDDMGGGGGMDDMGGGGGMDDMGMDDPDGMGDLDPGFDPSPSGMRAAMGPGGRMGGPGGSASRPPMGGQRGPFESSRRSRRPIAEDGLPGSGRIKGGLSGAGHEMDHVGEGGASVSGDGTDTGSGLPEDDTETTELKGKDLLGASQKNTIKPSQAFEGGGRGKLGSEGVALGKDNGMAENLSRLGRYLKQYLTEHDHGLRGQFRLAFRTKVDGKTASRRTALPDILADAEELLLVYGNKQVMVEAVYADRQGKVVYRTDIPLPRLQQRGPTVVNGRVLFRFNQIAEQFARRLVNEGLSCRVSGHNWGAAVATQLPSKRLSRVFLQLAPAARQ